jgi:uncharacterized membrane protein YwzB
LGGSSFGTAKDNRPKESYLCVLHGNAVDTLKIFSAINCWALQSINMRKKIRRDSMRRNEQICARVTADEMATLRSMAESQSMLLSQFIRQALTEKLASLTTGPDRAARRVSHRRDETVEVL